MRDLHSDRNPRDDSLEQSQSLNEKCTYLNVDNGNMTLDACARSGEQFPEGRARLKTSSTTAFGVLN